MNSRRAIEKALDEIFQKPERLKYEVSELGVYGNRVIYKHNQKTRTWNFPYGESLSIQSIRNKISGRRNVRPAFKV